MSRYVSGSRFRILKTCCADVRKHAAANKPFLSIASQGMLETLLVKFKKEGLVPSTEAISELASLKDLKVVMAPIDEILEHAIEAETDLDTIISYLKQTKSKKLASILLEKLETDMDQLTANATMDQLSNIISILHSQMSTHVQHALLEKASKAPFRRLGAVINVLRELYFYYTAVSSSSPSHKRMLHNLGAALNKSICDTRAKEPHKFTPERVVEVMAVLSAHVSHTNKLPETFIGPLLICISHGALERLSLSQICDQFLSTTIVLAFSVKDKLSKQAEKYLSLITSKIRSIPRRDWNELTPRNILLLLEGESYQKMKHGKRNRPASNTLVVCEQVFKSGIPWGDLSASTAVQIHSCASKLMIFEIIGCISQRITTRSRPFITSLSKNHAVRLLFSYGELIQEEARRNLNILNRTYVQRYIERLCEIIAQPRTKFTQFETQLILVSLVRCRTRHAPLLLQLCEDKNFNLKSGQQLFAAFARAGAMLNLGRGFWTTFLETINKRLEPVHAEISSTILWALLYSVPDMFGLLDSRFNQPQRGIKMFNLASSLPQLWAAASAGIQTPFLDKLAHRVQQYYPDSGTDYATPSEVATVIDQYFKGGDLSESFKQVKKPVISEGNFRMESPFNRFRIL
eukprot:TRINITY_DN15033_c0_g1_i1.p1 TRINITY_DN15033_c0_g1~~TRINITY_DN15033_c0_g1_i1.p1  ORF type:complete len:633 (+),score=63.79 TRINITY_DN15033_c0_g1_i1:64-1962(+)